MSTFQIDVLGALEAAGIQYQRSGSWVRIRAIWRESRAKDVAVHIDNGGWRDHGGLGEHGAWPSLCERLGIHCPTQTWTHEERAEYGRQMAAKRAEQDKEKAQDESRRMRAAMSLWERRSVSLDHHTDRHAAAMSDYIRYRGLRRETLMQVARAGQSNGLPCLVYGRRDPRTGKITTVHREWDKRTWPASEDSNKRGLGPQFWNGQTAYIEYNRWDGGAVASGAMAVIAEGQLSAACGAELYPRAPVLSVFTMGGLERPPVARIRDLVEAGFEILILGDRGGMKAAQACARAILLVCPGAKIRIAIPPEGRVEGQKKGEDWLDVRVGYDAVAGIGDDATRALIERRAVSPDLDLLPNGDGPGNRKNVLPLVPWERIESAPRGPEQPLEAAELSVLAAVRDWASAETPVPTIVQVTPGVGKTHRKIETIRASAKPFLVLCPTLDQAREVAAQIPGARLHLGRNEKNCKKFVTVKALTDHRRAPHAHACLTCEHGPDDSDDPCEYMPALRASVYSRVVVAVHGAGAEDSLLYSYCPDPAGDANAMIDRRVACDESPVINIETKIQATHIAEWRAGVARAEALLDAEEARLKGEIELAERFNQDPENARARVAGVEKARTWVRGIAPELDHLALALAAAPADRALHPITGLEGFSTLATKVPQPARHIDATLIESVDLRHAQAPVIPLKAIETLGVALSKGTAFFEAGTIVCMTTGALWSQIIGRGGLLLDATPSVRQVAEVEAVGGTVVTVRAAQPHLHVIQYGPRLHGRGGLKGNTLAREVEAVRQHAIEGAVVITHKPIGKEASDPRIGHWGRHHKAHNDWKDEDRLVLYGLNFLSPRDQLLQYRSDRTALAAVGVEWADWDGAATQGQTVETDGWRLRIGAHLPTVPQARAWVLDRLAADTAQGIARLRAVRRTKPVTVEIYGLLPLVGHGITVDEIQMESQGRLANKTRARAVLAQGVVDLGEARTRAKLVEYFRRQTGVRISNGDCDRLVAELKVQALASGMTLYEAARQSCAANTRLLSAGHEPWAIAQAAREIGGLPGVVAVASLLDQCRRAPGAQRAGP